jgi:hypothetical protein
MQDDTKNSSDEDVAGCGEGVYCYRETLFGVRVIRGEERVKMEGWVKTYLEKR